VGATGDFRAVLAQKAAGHALETVDQPRQGNLGWVLHQQVNVIVLAIAFDQFGLEIPADPGKDPRQVANGRFGQHVAAVSGDEDQLEMQHVNDMPASSVIRT